jgi:hypothetical protein
MTKYDVERGLREIAAARLKERSDFLLAETAKLARLVADGFRREFDDELDMEHVGKVLVIAAASLPPLVAGEAGVPGAVVMNLIAFAGEELVRAARARAPEAGEARGVERVLTWHQLNGAPPVEIPLNQHWVFPAEQCGEFRLSTKESMENHDG